MACLPLLEEWLCNIQGKTQENGDAEAAQTLVLPTEETEQKAELRIAPTDRELDRAAARMDGGTAAGWDGIPMSLVKAAGEETRQTIRDLLKHIMVNAEIPESWKDSRHCPDSSLPSTPAAPDHRPASLRQNSSIEMRAALKHGHIVREREGKAPDKDSDAEVKRVQRPHPCPEWKRRAQDTTLEEVREERAKCVRRIQERKKEKHQLFEQLKKFLEEEKAAGHRELERQANELSGAEAAAACAQFTVNQPAVGAVGQVGQPQPLYTQRNAPMPSSMTNTQSSTAASTDPSSLMQPNSSSPAQSLHSQAGYWTGFQYTDGPQVNGYGSMHVHCPPVVPSGTQQPAHCDAAQNVAWESGLAELPNNAAALASPFNTPPSMSRH
ncbi:hypothetical protein MTO96_036250 [Rhipicephalus appendiculatus]